jgi:uncharacterized 2Fe-2S/4Fe-4S cluster protein (DUF4445 family)
MFSVKFLPDNRDVVLEEATSLSDAAAYADVLVDHPCGSNATCGKCRVRFIRGATEPSIADQRLISAADIKCGWRLSCQNCVEQDAEVEVPVISRVASTKHFGSDNLLDPDADLWVRARQITLPEADLDNQWAILDSISRETGSSCGLSAELKLLQELPGIVSENPGSIDVLLHGSELISVRSHDNGFTPALGIALDVGSTSLAAALCDMATGRVLASASALNPQVKYGGDVISRIDHAMQHENGNQQLHDCLLDGLQDLFKRIASEAESDLKQVSRVCVCGNPAMMHTLAGVDVRPLGIAPYVGTWTRELLLRADEAGFRNLPGNAKISFLPMIRSNVGSDTVAAILATGVDQSEKLRVLIDLGTNCEVVVGNRDRLLATSTAAGPAFEGASMRNGMRAAPGAIDRVSLRRNGRLGIRIIGGVKARGICGSGLIDSAAVLLRSGIVDASGRMHGRDAAANARFPELCERIVIGEDGHPAVILAGADQTDRRVPIGIGALDIRQLQLIKGSIHAGIRLLLNHLSVAYSNIEEVLIAGAFGSFLRKSSVVDIGLVPAIDPEKIVFVGNAAGTGARLALLDRNASRRAAHIRESAEYIELGGHPDYQEIFGESMGFSQSPALLEAART